MIHVRTEGSLFVKGRLPRHATSSSFQIDLMALDDESIQIRVDDAKNPEFWLEIVISPEAVKRASLLHE